MAKIYRSPGHGFRETLVFVLEAVGELIPYAVGVALSPAPLIAVLLLLLSPGGLAAGVTFLAGRVVTVAAVAAVFSLVSESIPESDGESLLSALLRLLLGLALVVVAVRKIVRRPGADDAVELPTWMASIEVMRPAAAARLGVVLSVANVKELAFGLGVGLIVGGAELTAGASIAVVVVYTAIASLTVAAPVVMFWLAEDRARPPLTTARAWLVSNNSVVIAAVLLVIGAILIGNGLTAL